MIVVKWILRIILTLIILAMLAISFLLTPYGFKFMIYLGEKALPGQIHYQKIDGMILGPIHVAGLDYRYKKNHIHINKLDFNWRPTDLLFHKKITITKLTGNGITATLPSSPKKETPKLTTKEQIDHFLKSLHPFEPQPLHLPFSININHAHVTNLKYVDQHGNVKANIKTIDINGAVNPNKINLVAHTELLEPVKLDVRLTAIGSLKHYKVDLSLDSGKYHAALHGEGNKKGAVITVPDTKVFGGEVKATLKLNWFPKISWNIDANAKNLDLSILNPALPKSANLVLNTKGQLNKNKPDIDLILKAHADTTNIAAEAHLHKIWQAKWDINIPHIHSLFKAASGIIYSKGTLSGDLTKPITSGTLQAKNINLQKLNVGSINANWNLYFDSSKDSNLKLLINKITYNKIKLDVIHINTAGNLEKHNIEINFDIGKHQLMSTIDAHYDGVHWDGKILKFTSRHNAFGNWHLRNISSFRYSPDTAFLKPLCLDANTGAFLCASANWEKGKPWHVSVQSKKFSFTKLEKKAMIAMQFTSKISMNANVTGIGKDIENANIKMAMTPGMLTYAVGKQIINTAIRPSTVNLEINKALGLRAYVNLAFAEKDAIKVNLSVPNFTDYAEPFKDKKFTGDVHILMHDFRFVTLIESVLKISLGRMAGEFKLYGTLGDPKFEGEAKLHIPKFEYTLIHVKAHNLNAHIYAKNNKLTYDLLGYAHNDAPLTMKGETDLDGPHGAITRFVVTAENAEIIKNNKFDVYATTALHFLLNPTDLKIHGDVLIPTASLKPISFANTVTMPKGHVEYIGLPKKDQSKGGHKIDLNLNIKLGKNVQLNAFGLRSHLEGGLRLTMSPQQTTMANGQVRISSGTFQAYGQYLTIAKGSSISFIQSPVSNPFIDARAYKYINTTTEAIGQQLSRDELIVGVHIYGTVKQMKFKLYSEPGGISQADILSYLVLGYASGNTNAASLSVLMDAASAMIDSGGGLEQPVGFADRIKQGLGITQLGVRNETVLDAIGNPIDNQSSFVVGDQLTKNIYIQYSRGMIVPDNIFQIQYRFNKNWILQTTTGTGGNVGTGADVLYTISSD